MQTNPIHYTKETLYAALRGTIDLKQLVPTCIRLAKEVEHMTQLKGKEKLEALQYILRLSIHDSTISAEEKETYYFTVDRIVPLVVEGIVLASKSPILVRQVQAVCCGCWTKK